MKRNSHVLIHCISPQVQLLYPLLALVTTSASSQSRISLVNAGLAVAGFRHSPFRFIISPGKFCICTPSVIWRRCGF